MHVDNCLESGICVVDGVRRTRRNRSVRASRPIHVCAMPTTNVSKRVELGIQGSRLHVLPCDTTFYPRPRPGIAAIFFFFFFRMGFPLISCLLQLLLGFAVCFVGAEGRSTRLPRFANATSGPVYVWVFCMAQCISLLAFRFVTYVCVN